MALSTAMRFPLYSLSFPLPAKSQWAFGQRFRGGSLAETNAIVSALGTVNSKLVLVVPAYLTDAQDYIPLVETLRKRGYDAALPPIRWFNWVPTIGGRSLRPILDRVDFALTQLVDGAQVGPDTGYEISLPSEPSWIDWLTEFSDASKGVRPPIGPEGPRAESRRAAVVACSASGWICRILLGAEHQYCGRVYNGRDRVHTLLTLGAPHACNEAVSRRNIAFVNKKYPGCFENGVQYVCVAGEAVRGTASLGGLLQDFTYQSYELCLPGSGNALGDGVTPVESALAMDGAQKLVLKDVWHLPKDAVDGKQWYGSEGVVDSWEVFLKEQD